MPKYCIDAALDDALDYIIANANSLRVCTSDVTTGGVPDADKCTDTSASALTASHALVAGDFAKADGDVSGRKLTIAAQADLPIAATGEAAHIVLLDETTPGSEIIIYMTTCTAQSLTSGNNVSVPAWDIELRDPA